MLLIYSLHTFSLQGITEPREDWYWPEAENDDEDDDLKEETEDVEDVVNLTVSLNFILLFICFRVRVRVVEFCGG